MIFADALSFLRYSKAPSIIALIQLSLTFAVLGNVLAMVDAYREQIVSVSGYFDEDGLLAVSLYKNGNEVPSSRWRDEIARDLEAIEAVPGVVEIALAHEGVPMQRNLNVNNQDVLRVLGDDTNGQPATRYSASENTVSVLGLTLIYGREFYETEIGWFDSIEREGKSVLLTETLARSLFGSANASIGEVVENGVGNRLTVVGVVERAKGVYWKPFDQHSYFVAGKSRTNEAFLVRLDQTSLDVDFKNQTILELSENLFDIDSNRQIRIETIDEIEKVNLGRFIILNTIVGIIAGMLMLVTAIGNFGLVSYSLGAREKNIKIRRALGTPKTQIYGIFILENLILTSVGILFGLVFAAVFNSLIVQFVGYGKLSASSLLVSILLVLVVSLISVCIPLRKKVQGLSVVG